MRTIRVPLGQRSYLIKVGPGLLSQLGKECRRLGLGTRCAIITDTNVGPLYARAARTSLREAGFDPLLITVPSGDR